MGDNAVGKSLVNRWFWGVNKPYERLGAIVISDHKQLGW